MTGSAGGSRRSQEQRRMGWVVDDEMEDWTGRSQDYKDFDMWSR